MPSANRHEVGDEITELRGKLQRLGSDRAWPATLEALKAVGLGILIELSFATLAALTWLIGAIAA